MASRSRSLYFDDLFATRYRGMTAAQMDAAARAVIDPSKFIWVVVGDASVVRPQLANLGLEIEVIPAQ